MSIFQYIVFVVFPLCVIVYVLHRKVGLKYVYPPCRYNDPGQKCDCKDGPAFCVNGKQWGPPKDCYYRTHGFGDF